MRTYINNDAIIDHSIEKIKLADSLVAEIESMERVTYEELAILKSRCELVPGKQYRIINYETTISHTRSADFISAGHKFDIIVTAISDCEFSEEARATYNENEGYFDICNLSAWKIWYSFNNDAYRFTWAQELWINTGYSMMKLTGDANIVLDTPLEFEGFMINDPVNGETYGEFIQAMEGTASTYAGIVGGTIPGVDIGNIPGVDNGAIEGVVSMGGDKIYEFTIIDDVPAFYKSDPDYFEEEGHPDYEDYFLYTGNVVVDGVEYDSWLKHTDGHLAYADDDGNGNGTMKIYALTQRVVVSGKGVIYRMIDEWGNDVPYDFKNIVNVANLTDVPYYYTFSYVNVDQGVVDLSIFGQKTYDNDIFFEGQGVHDNVIKECMYNDRQHFDWKPFIIYGAYDVEIRRNYIGCNTTGVMFTLNCDDDTAMINDNVIESNCDTVHFFSDDTSGYFLRNTIGSNSKMIVFNNDAYDNTIGKDSRSIELTFGSCNVFGEYCNNIILGTNSSYNEFGSYCQSIRLGTNCCHNVFGSGCQSVGFYTAASIEPSYLRPYSCYNVVGPGTVKVCVYNTVTASSNNGIINHRIHRRNNTALLTVATPYLNSTSEIHIGTSEYTGSLYASGFYETSDENYKVFSDKVVVDFDKLKSLRKSYFQWKDSDDKSYQIGVSAQEVQAVYPEIVKKNDGRLTVAYDKLSVIALAAIDVLHAENEMLRQQINTLDVRLRQLEDKK